MRIDVIVSLPRLTLSLTNTVSSGSPSSCAVHDPDRLLRHGIGLVDCHGLRAQNNKKVPSNFAGQTKVQPNAFVLL